MCFGDERVSNDAEEAREPDERAGDRRERETRAYMAREPAINVDEVAERAEHFEEEVQSEYNEPHRFSSETLYYSDIRFD